MESRTKPDAADIIGHGIPTAVHVQRLSPKGIAQHSSMDWLPGCKTSVKTIFAAPGTVKYLSKG